VLYPVPEVSESPVITSTRQADHSHPMLEQAAQMKQEILQELLSETFCLPEHRPEW
jgi:hypothetical protein